MILKPKDTSRMWLQVSEMSVSLTNVEKLLLEVNVLLLAEAGLALNHLLSKQALY